MIPLDPILASARAEIRSARRLVRTWMFIVVALLIALVGYGQQVAFHAIGSGMSVTVGAILAPRFVVAQLGAQMLWVLMAALIFLAFDIRARDRRDRMLEVLDSRPVDNFASLLGRVLGLVLVGWLPLALVAVLTVALAGLAAAADWPISPAVEPLSMVAMLFVDAPVALTLWCAIVVLIAVVVRNRLAVALISLAVLGAYIFGFFRSPTYLIGSFAPIGDMVGMPSDLAPLFLSWQSALQRVCYLAIAFGLLALAAVAHPRPDSAGGRARLAAGAGLAVAGLIGIGGLALSLLEDRRQLQAWAEAHEAVRQLPRADLETLRGSVSIKPGVSLAVDVDATLRAPAAGDASELVFTLNPGMAVSELLIDGQPTDHTHAAGILTIAADATEPGRQFTLSLRADGRPDIRFAYLDAAFDPMAMRAFESGALLLLGLNAALFHSDYVALMPGIRWLPMPGAHVGLDDPERGRDFFTMDIQVEAPAGWLVAAPGKRQPLRDGDRRDNERDGFRFSPGAPVTEFGVFAAPFERFAMDVDGVTLELLVSPKHAENLLFFADAADELASRIETMLRDAERIGLPYPYDGFSLVELPMGVRSFGGGWQMGTTLSLPGVMLLPEGGLPLAQFGFHMRNREELENLEGGVPRAKVDKLVESLANDFGGGNPFIGAAHNFLTFQTGATGVGAAALDAMLLHLANRLITDREGYFSAFGMQSQLQSAIGAASISTFTGDGPSVAGMIRDAAVNRPAVWDRALGESLSDLAVDDDPEVALSAMTLRTTAASRTILEALGREQAAGLLSELRRRFSGRNFTAAEFEALAEERGADLGAVLGDWLSETAMPGYVTSPARAYRLPDSDTGEPRYQVLLDVRNDEPAPGLFWLAGRIDAGDGAERSTGPIRIEPNTSMEVGLVTPAPPNAIWLGFHMALNRQTLRLVAPSADATEVVDAAPFNGGRESAWLPETGDAVVVDDLDAGFSVEYDSGVAPETGGGFAIALGAVPSPDMDEGLPQHTLFTSGGGAWTRQQHPGAWGKYRRTLARARIARSNARAIFAAELPTTGRWRLDYHVPHSTTGRQQSFSGPGVQVQINQGGPGVPAQGAYDMTLVVGGESQAIEFDGAAAESGWNRLGEFDLVDRAVRVVVANGADAGDTVLADAVRFVPVGER